VTYGQGWTPPPAPPPRPRRYATKWIWFGIAIGIVTTLALPSIGLGVASLVRQRWLSPVLFLIGVVVPLVSGIILTAQQGSPARRGLGLGTIIGWALAPILFAGVCLVVVVVLVGSTGQ